MCKGKKKSINIKPNFRDRSLNTERGRMEEKGGGGVLGIYILLKGRGVSSFSPAKG